MKAAVGDRLTIESRHLDGPRRIGIITALHNSDGSPPYVVRWLDEEHETLIFPGPGAHVEHREHHAHGEHHEHAEHVGHMTTSGT